MDPSNGSRSASPAYDDAVDGGNGTAHSDAESLPDPFAPLASRTRRAVMQGPSMNIDAPLDEPRHRCDDEQNAVGQRDDTEHGREQYHSVLGELDPFADRQHSINRGHGRDTTVTATSTSYRPSEQHPPDSL